MAARDALRNAMQPSAYKEFLLRSVSVHGPSPFDRLSNEDGTMLGTVYSALQQQQQQQRLPAQNASTQTLSLAAALSVAPTQPQTETREAICMTEPWTRAPSTDRALQVDVSPDPPDRSTDRRSQLSDAWSSDGEGPARKPTLNARGLANAGRVAAARGWGDPGDAVPAAVGEWMRQEQQRAGSASVSPPTARTDASWPYRHGLRATGTGSESDGLSRTNSLGPEHLPAPRSPPRSRSRSRSRSPLAGAGAIAGGEFERAGPPVVDGRHDDRHSLRVSPPPLVMSPPRASRRHQPPWPGPDARALSGCR